MVVDNLLANNQNSFAVLRVRRRNICVCNKTNQQHPCDRERLHVLEVYTSTVIKKEEKSQLFNEEYTICNRQQILNSFHPPYEGNAVPEVRVVAEMNSVSGVVGIPV